MGIGVSDIAFTQTPTQTKYMFLILFLLIMVMSYALVKSRGTHEIKEKRILVIGGSSGLGLAFAKILKKKGNDVTVTSRNMERLQTLRNEWGFEIEVLDVCDFSEVPGQATEYDYIFCCAGASYPSYFNKQAFKVFEKTMNTNYLGTVGALKHYSSVNKRPFSFIMIGSTLALFTFPGFSSYSPSKAALLSFFYTVYDEMKRAGIDLHFYNTASIMTPGYERENETKPAYTKSIENMGMPSSAEERAAVFLNNMNKRKVVASDIFTYLCQIRMDCERFMDYIMFPTAIAVVFISKTYVRWSFGRCGT